MTISMRAQDVRGRRLQAQIGQPVHANYLDAVHTLINSDPQAVQITAITVDTATNSHAYTFTVDGITVTYTADASATKPEIANGIEAAINGDPRIYGSVSADSDGVDVVTLTGQYPGVAFTVAALDALLSQATSQAAAAAAAVPFGRLMISGGFQTNEDNELGILVRAGALTAQVDTLAVTYAAGELYGVSIAVDGEEYGVEVEATVDTATTHAALVTALNAILPANTVLAAGTSPNLTLTAEVAGKPFRVSRWLKSGTVARLTLTHTTATRATDINRVAVGVSLFAYDEEISTIAGVSASYPANAGVPTFKSGEIWVACATSPSPGDPVYVETNVTADNGKFFSASSATRIRLDRASWQRVGRNGNGDAIGVIALAPSPYRA